MKINDLYTPILLIALGAAFLAVSLWVFFSKNRKSIHYKYKLGGMILSLSFFAATQQSCMKGSMVTCYDPMPSNYISLWSNNQNQEQLTSNDTVFAAISGWNFGHYSYELSDSTRSIIFDANMLNTQPQGADYYIPLNSIPTDYSGDFFVSIYGEARNAVAHSELLESRRFSVNK